LLVKGKEENKKFSAKYCGINSSKKDSFSPFIFCDFFMRIFKKKHHVQWHGCCFTRTTSTLSAVEKCFQGK
jgi:hypothetical protein